MRRAFMVLAVSLIALPIFAEQKKPTVTPTPSASETQRLKKLDMRATGRVVQPTVTPTAGPLEATTVKGSKSNGSERVGMVTPAPSASEKAMKIRDLRSAEVTKVNEKDETFTVTTNGKEVQFSAKEMKALPEVGDVIDLTYTQTTPGGPLVAAPTCCTKSIKSNSSARIANSPKVMTGKVTRVNEKDKTFIIMTKGEEVTLSASELKALPEVGRTIDITYTQTTPGGPLNAISLNSSRSNIY